MSKKLDRSVLISKAEYHEHKLREIHAQLQRTNNTEKLKMTEHAKVQYLSRIKGFDMAAIEKEVLTDRLQNIYNTLGNGTYPIADDDLVAVVENGFVITVYRSK